MTLAQISDASQAIAAVAVVASLIILILQNRQANLLKRDEATRRQMEGSQNILRALFELPGIAEIWRQGIANIDQLTDEDRIKFIAFTTYTLRIWEGSHQEYLRGQLDEGIWRAHAQMLRSVQDFSGIKRVWTLRRFIFSEVFLRFYDAHATQGVAADLYGLGGDK